MADTSAPNSPSSEQATASATETSRNGQISAADTTTGGIDESELSPQETSLPSVTQPQSQAPFSSSPSSFSNTSYSLPESTTSAQQQPQQQQPRQEPQEQQPHSRQEQQQRQNPPAPPHPLLLGQNIFNININPGNGNGEENLIIIRDRLFHAIYFKVAVMYALIVTKPFQRALEYFVLFKALLFFAALVYVHFLFIKEPCVCWDNADQWPRDGVLRVEVVPNLGKRLEFFEKTQFLEDRMRSINQEYFYGIGPKTRRQFRNQQIMYNNETYTNYIQEIQKYENGIRDLYKDEKYAILDEDEDEYIVEYSLEYGHLRLSSATRERLGIPVRLVQLDPDNNRCFGDRFSKFLLKELLGYDDLLMASVRVIAEKEQNKGYLRDVISGDHYRFVSTWWTAWTSFPTAFFVMILFTFSISMLLRFSHHQIFVFIVDLLQMLEFNISSRFPIAPLIIVVLALVGLEAIMSEFFNDTTTAFYIIIIVWLADQFDAVCCHTSITKRHWLRFFFLYHYAFYAYHYRFNGQNRSLALVSSWLFIQHSMLYFFHRYELPVIMQQTHILIITRNQHIDGSQPEIGRNGAAAPVPETGQSTDQGVGGRGTGPRNDQSRGDTRRQSTHQNAASSDTALIQSSVFITPGINLMGNRLGNRQRPNFMRLIALQLNYNNNQAQRNQQPRPQQHQLLPRPLLSVWEFLGQLINTNNLRRAFFRRGYIYNPMAGAYRPVQGRRRRSGQFQDQQQQHPEVEEEPTRQQSTGHDDSEPRILSLNRQHRGNRIHQESLTANNSNVIHNNMPNNNIITGISNSMNSGTTAGTNSDSNINAIINNIGDNITISTQDEANVRINNSAGGDSNDDNISDNSRSCTNNYYSKRWSNTSICTENLSSSIQGTNTIHSTGTTNKSISSFSSNDSTSLTNNHSKEEYECKAIEQMIDGAMDESLNVGPSSPTSTTIRSEKWKSDSSFCIQQSHKNISNTETTVMREDSLSVLGTSSSLSGAMDAAL